MMAGASWQRLHTSLYSCQTRKHCSYTFVPLKRVGTPWLSDFCPFLVTLYWRVKVYFNFPCHGLLSVDCRSEASSHTRKMPRFVTMGQQLAWYSSENHFLFFSLRSLKYIGIFTCLKFNVINNLYLSFFSTWHLHIS